MKDEKIKEIMNSIENRVRHAYNCGYHDGVEDTKKWLTSEVIDRITEGVDKAILYGIEGKK